MARFDRASMSDAVAALARKWPVSIDQFQRLVVALLLTAGCARGVRTSFHPTDPSFTPRATSRPRVYLHAADVPREALRSVGIIEVTVPDRSWHQRAVDAAAVKGQAIGCVMLVEHDAFAALGRRATLAHGAVVILAHGTAGNIRGGPKISSLTVEFHCLIRDETRA
jgi:hypothetical protein